jgi:peroxiredoxin
VAGLEVGQKITYFELPDQQDYPWSLSGQLEMGPVMLIFYSGDWSPYCNGQLASYARRFEEFEKRGAQLAGISVDPPANNAGMVGKLLLPFPLLSDPEGELATRRGCPRRPRRARQRDRTPHGRTGVPGRSEAGGREQRPPRSTRHGIRAAHPLLSGRLLHHRDPRREVRGIGSRRKAGARGTERIPAAGKLLHRGPGRDNKATLAHTPASPARLLRRLVSTLRPAPSLVGTPPPSGRRLVSTSAGW